MSDYPREDIEMEESEPEPTFQEESRQIDERF